MVRLAGAEQGGSYPPVVTFSEQRFRKEKINDISLKNKFIPLFQSSNLEKKMIVLPFRVTFILAFVISLAAWAGKNWDVWLDQRVRSRGFLSPVSEQCFRKKWYYYSGFILFPLGGGIHVVIFHVGYPPMRFITDIIHHTSSGWSYLSWNGDARLLIVEESSLPPFLFWELSICILVLYSLYWFQKKLFRKHDYM